MDDAAPAPRNVATEQFCRDVNAGVALHAGTTSPVQGGVFVPGSPCRVGYGCDNFDGATLRLRCVVPASSPDRVGVCAYDCDASAWPSRHTCDADERCVATRGGAFFACLPVCPSRPLPSVNPSTSYECLETSAGGVYVPKSC